MASHDATLSPTMRDTLLEAQRNEITEYHIYRRLADASRDEHNSEVLRQIAEDEHEHYRFWRSYTNQDVEPKRLKLWWFVLIARVLGLTFGIKLMERGEESAQDVYSGIAETLPSARRIVRDEDSHEDDLIAMLDEERLRYVGSVVLGLNDALVELTGTLAGLTLALQNTRLIGMAGLITGIAASLSMGASEYLSTKSEEGVLAEGEGAEGEEPVDPLKASLYTGGAYVLTVALLITPFFVVQSYLLALGWTVLNAVLVILVFTFYISVARDLDFRRRFIEMAAISLGVAVLSFGIGFVVREFLGIDV